MKKKTLLDMQPILRKGHDAYMADLPRALRDLGFQLSVDSSSGFRIPGRGGLIIWQGDDNVWRWTHHSSGESGDTVQFLTEFHGMDRLEAIETLAPYRQLNLPESPSRQRFSYSLGESSGVKIRKIDLPPPKWRERAGILVRQAIDCLTTEPTGRILKWLHERGLNDETINETRLGIVSEDSWESREGWGLKEEYNVNGDLKKIWLPGGLLIPIFDQNGGVARLWVRRFADGKPKYYIVPGSSSSTFVLGKPGKSMVLCESDLDTLLINQEAKDLVSVASLGGSGNHPDTRLMAYLLTAQKILVALDADDAGEKGSEKWLKTFPNAKRWMVPWRKDPGEAFGRSPSLVKVWISSGLHQ